MAETRSVWDDLIRRPPRDPALEPRPWDEDGLVELRQVALHNVEWARILTPILRLRLGHRAFETSTGDTG